MHSHYHGVPGRFYRSRHLGCRCGTLRLLRRIGRPITGCCLEDGVELDSLADLVVLVLPLLLPSSNFCRDHTLLPDLLSRFEPVIPYLAFLIPLFSAYRLAKFNIDDRQTTSFLGLPTPANGLFWVSYVCGTCLAAGTNGFYLYLTAGLILVLSLLMISEIPMFSLKIKSMKIKGNERQLLLIVIMTGCVVFWESRELPGYPVLHCHLTLLDEKRRESLQIVYFETTE